MKESNTSLGTTKSSHRAGTSVLLYIEAASEIMTINHQGLVCRGEEFDLYLVDNKIISFYMEKSCNQSMEEIMGRIRI